MSAVAHRARPKASLKASPKASPKAGPQPRRKIFHATLLVTRIEQWWVEAATAEEAQALLASGEGHHAALGERIHVELEGMLDGAE